MPQVKAKKNSGARTVGASNSKIKTSGNGSARTLSKSVAQRQSSAAGGEMLEKFLIDSLKDIYWAEKHLTKALPKMMKAATSEELKAAINEHLSVTEKHVARLEEVFELMGKKAQAKKCEAMEGLTKEAESIIEETEKGTATRDVGIIMAAQKVEHYEIATYGGLVQLTKTMGYTEVSDILAQTLAEEKEADESLTEIAENNINLQAETESDVED